MTKVLQALCLAALVLLVPALSSAGELSLTIKDGRVTLVADSVPLRQILAEWARVGQTRVVNGERVSGAPVTLRLENVPEQAALETLLRTVTGYMAAPRAAAVADASMFDRILILPTALAPPAPASAAAGPRPAGQPMAPPPAPVAMQQEPKPPAVEGRFEAAEEEADDEPANNGAPMPPQPGAMIDPYTGKPPETNFDYANPPQLQPGQQQAPALFPGSVVPQAPGTTGQQNGATTGVVAPVTTSRPGEMVQPPPQQQQPFVNPYATPDRAKYANPYQTKPPQSNNREHD